ncbi:NAD-dependent epimerase/dehydratase family protein [Shewanella sp. HN-41]|uniref:NAD-dependent epimerase/dehydratase family protein n=1 Tax=Shewanella sp. HN-41 TaxID=327275 RepID=UPI0002125F36|nr:NAD-dependent epimerase/dehydratase family protein [Shewanella sp. HN-41]EGM69238.1 UDP-glucose 4-epimerase [Shewanella sp. HN-41]
MKVLVTGVTGFIGREVIRHQGNFRCVTRCSDKLNVDDVFLVNKIDANTNWADAFDDVETVIHIAGLAHNKQTPQSDYQSVNTLGTLHLAREAVNAGVKRFVFVSSIGVNGTFTSDKPFTFNESERPHNYYARSKYSAEVGLKKLAVETGLEVVIVRPTLVYGPNAPGNFGLLTKLVKKLPVLPFGLANNKRDFIAVQNLADLLITCATHPNAAGHTFLASDMETVSIKQFTNAIADGLDKKTFQLPIPVSLMRLVGKLTGKSAMIEQLYGSLQVDSSNIKEVLDWTPPLTMKQAMATLRDSGK